MPTMSVLILHGAGSSGAAAAGLLGDALDGHGPVHLVEDRSGDVSAIIRRLDAAPLRVDVAIGVSLGAHALARWAAVGVRTPPLLLCLPAWTGAPAEVARATAHTADRLSLEGRTRLLSALPSSSESGEGRLADLVRTGWAAYTEEELVAALRMAARQRGPTVAELRSIEIPCAIVGWRGDHLHPHVVAEEWASLIPRAQMYLSPTVDPRGIPLLVRRALVELRTRRTRPLPRERPAED